MLSNEHLGPIIPGLVVAHANLGIGAAEDVGPVAAGVHPGADHGGGGALTVGDVLPGGAEGDAEAAHHLVGGAVGGAFVGEVALTGHVCGFVAGHPAELPVLGEGFEAVLGPLGVDQPDHLLLVGADRLGDLGDVQHLSRGR